MKSEFDDRFLRLSSLSGLGRTFLVGETMERDEVVEGEEDDLREERGFEGEREGSVRT